MISDRGSEHSCQPHVSDLSAHMGLLSLTFSAQMSGSWTNLKKN